VRRVEQILREKLDCRRGFADERVVVLDPCCGTGAYLIEVVRCIAAEARRRGDEGTLAAELMHAVAQRIVGFEILTAPFVIAQLQLYLLLSDAGANPDRHQRPAVFLTNALTGWDDPAQIKVNFPELREEHDLAQKVKRDGKIIVVLGNPPYNRFAGTALDEEADLVDRYKGIRRAKDKSGKLKQVGESLLYTRWGIRKQLLDDLYIRFFRLAEKRIGEKAEYGVVSFISNSSYLTGRSHPLMRESLLKNFHEIWIDNTHGNRIASERTPWGESCETLFSFDGGTGIKVGTCITTLVKDRRAAIAPESTPLHFRDFWGRADAKRRALLDSLDMDRWKPARKVEAAKHPEGPRDYETVQATAAARWMFAPLRNFPSVS
jgi:predicted helicase